MLDCPGYLSVARSIVASTTQRENNRMSQKTVCTKTPGASRHVDVVVLVLGVVGLVAGLIFSIPFLSNDTFCGVNSSHGREPGHLRLSFVWLIVKG